MKNPANFKEEEYRDCIKCVNIVGRTAKRMAKGVHAKHNEDG